MGGWELGAVQEVALVDRGRVEVLDLALGLEHAPVQAAGIGRRGLGQGMEAELGQLGLGPAEVLVLLRLDLGDGRLDGLAGLAVRELLGQLAEQLPVGVAGRSPGRRPGSAP